MDLEQQYAVALGILSVVLWAGGWLLGKTLAGAPPRVLRTVLPIMAMMTFACFAVFVAIARHNIKG